MSKFSEKGVIINEIQSVALSTLANETALKLSTITLQSSNFRMMKSVIEALVFGLTAGEGAGLLLGIASNELTVAEIAEALTVDGPTDRNDRVAKERAERPVFIISQLDEGEVNTKSLFHGEGNNPQIVRKHPWTWTATEGWCFFIFNNSNATLTTGATAKIHAKHFGMWVD